MNLTSTQILQWTARILSAASLLMLSAFLFGEDGLHPSRIKAHEWVGLFFFPFGVAVGLILGWWNERLGGIVAIASLLGFYLIYGWLVRGSMAMGWYFVLFASPGFLFLLSALMKSSVKKPLHN
ncbi:MAG: hypothetical protein JST84_18485 [Acidobacteria bacterium]|nr:hypothetical protein [Acidobacteriota bacterium]